MTRTEALLINLVRFVMNLLEDLRRVGDLEVLLEEVLQFFALAPLTFVIDRRVREIYKLGKIISVSANVIGFDVSVKSSSEVYEGETDPEVFPVDALAWSAGSKRREHFERERD
jgi:hypothetical protein